MNSQNDLDFLILPIPNAKECATMSNIHDTEDQIQDAMLARQALYLLISVISSLSIFVFVFVFVFVF